MVEVAAAKSPSQFADGAKPARSELWQLDAADLAPMIALGKVSSSEAVRSCLDRLESVNSSINAVVRQFPEEALAAAAAADAAVRSGVPHGPLHGVPVTVKVNVDQRGHPTDNAVTAYRHLVATEDNPVVANLRRAGAVIIGRTNTPCYSMRWFTENTLHGPTLNPWDRSRTPGGSTGGGAAAVAAGIGPIAHGNDIAGSVRYPAYCCGLAGLRPSYGRVPSSNATAKALSSISSQLMAVQGPLARSVRDLRLGFAAMAVPDPRDPRCVVPAPLPAPPRPIRVALVPGFAGRRVHPAVTAAVNSAGASLAAAGYAVEEREPPQLIETGDLWPKIATADIMRDLTALIEQNGDDGIKRAVALWDAVWPKYTAADTLTALGERLRALRDWQLFFETWPLIVMPVSLEPPFAAGLDVEDEATTARILAAQSPMLSISVLGLPAVTIPTGLHEGVPVGVQIVAGRYREDLCFDAAEVIEAHHPMPTPIDPRL
jgi:amidase